MIQDLNLRMDQVIVATSAASASYIDTLAAGDSMPAGVLAQWKVLCVTSPVTATAGTLTVQLQTSPNALFDSNAVTLLQTAAVTLSTLVQQTANVAPPTIDPVIFCGPIPSGVLQFVRTYYSYSAGASFVTGPGIISEIILDQDKLVGATLGSLQK